MDEVVVTGVVAAGGGRRAAAYGAVAIGDPLRGVDNKAASCSRRWRWDSGAAVADGDGGGDRTKMTRTSELQRHVERQEYVSRRETQEVMHEAARSFPNAVAFGLQLV